MITMTHPGVAGSAQTTAAAFTAVWEPLGWVMVEPGTASSYLPAPMRYRGDWSSTLVYEPGDVVEYDDDEWVAVEPSLNDIPGTDPEWAVASGLRGRATSAISIATRAQHQNSGSTSNGTDIGGTFRIRHVVVASARGMRFAFANIHNINRSEGDWSAAGPFSRRPIAIRATLEYPGAGSDYPATQFVPLTVNGKQDFEVGPGAVVWTDIVDIEVAQNDVLFTRTLVRVLVAGDKWPLSDIRTVTADARGQQPGRPRSNRLHDGWYDGGPVCWGADSGCGPHHVRLDNPPPGRPLYQSSMARHGPSGRSPLRAACLA